MSEAVDLVGQLLAGYPNPNVSDSYIGAMAAVLCDYPRDIANKCCDPLKGVVRLCKFVPTIADVVAWCEPLLEEMRAPVNHFDRNAALADRVRQQRAEDDYWQKARAERPNLDEMKAHYGPNWGITQPQRKQPKPYQSLTDDDLRRLYGKRHDEVVAEPELDEVPF